MEKFKGPSQYDLWKDDGDGIIPNDLEVAEKWAIGKLERNEFNLSDQARMNIILTMKGAKPGSEFNAPPEKATKVAEMLKTIRIYSKSFKTEEAETTKKINITSVKFIISKDKETLERIAKTLMANDKNFSKIGYLESLNEKEREEYRKNEIQFGLNFGYPKTAVEAFANRDEKMGWEDLPKDIKGSPVGEIYRKFSLFSFSTEHWEEEWEVFKKWVSIIKYTSPKIFEQLLEAK